jgi:glycosyltransferase involved in cell wall biosynthesis
MPEVDQRGDLADARFLDTLDLHDLLPTPGTIYADEPWGEKPGRPSVVPVRRNRVLSAVSKRLGSWPLVAGLVQLISDLEFACRLLVRSCRAGSVGLMEGERAAFLLCLLRSFLRTPGKVVLWEVHLYPQSGLEKKLLRRALASATVVVYSRRTAENYCREFQLPQEIFRVIPYKANHSKYEPEKPVMRGDYVFSGGNSDRDYRTLFQAVEGLEIPVVVSATVPFVTQGLSIPKNVILVAAEEPHFRRLMAAARLVVVPLTAGRLRLAGVASFLNAMWHGRPVICADDVAAPEYVSKGVDGVVVSPGDAAALRLAICNLWGHREKAEAMGEAARTKVKSAYTHDLFCERMLKLACLVSQEQTRRAPAAATPLTTRGVRG